MELGDFGDSGRGFEVLVERIEEPVGLGRKQAGLLGSKN